MPTINVQHCGRVFFIVIIIFLFHGLYTVFNPPTSTTTMIIIIIQFTFIVRYRMSVGLTLAPKGSTPPRGVHIRRHTTDDHDDRSVGPTARRHTVKEHVGFASPRSSAAPHEQFRSCAPLCRLSVVVVRSVSFLVSRVRRVVVFSAVPQTILIFRLSGECVSADNIEKPISVQEVL